MATVIGDAARYTTARSIRISQQIFLTTIVLVIALTLFEGALATLLVTKGLDLPLSLIVSGIGAALIIARLCKAQIRRIGRYERERRFWRGGAEGERAIAALLARLPDSFFVFNDVRVKFGNLDHVVIGPTGLFLLETRNWRGVVSADGNGELIYNDFSQSTPHIRRFLATCMTTFDQVRKLIRRDDIRFRALMVFPKARVDALFGSTGRVHCLTDEQLSAYLQNERFSAKLSRAQVRTLARAFEKILQPDAVTSPSAQPAANSEALSSQPIPVG